MSLVFKGDEMSDKLTIFVSKTSKKPSKMTCDKVFEVLY